MCKKRFCIVFISLLEVFLRTFGFKELYHAAIGARIKDVSRKKGVKKRNLIKVKFLAKIGDEKMEAALVVIKHGSGIEYE